MSEQNTVLRSMHDIGLAGWFGGSLMGAVGLNGAAAQAPNPAERLQIASAGWDRWAPVNFAAIGAHLVGAAGILVAEAPRVATQKGVGAMSVVKTALTAAALGATVYSRLAGKKMEKAGGTPVEGITEPAPSTPEDVSGAQRQQRVARAAPAVRLQRASVAAGAALGLAQRRGVRPAGGAGRGEERPVRLLRGMAEVTLEAVQEDRRSAYRSLRSTRLAAPAGCVGAD